MINSEEKKIIVECAKKYEIGFVMLFGSASKKDDYADIDLGVEGINPKLFFTFYAELFKKLKKTVDVVDLGEDTLFSKLIKETGVKIYG